VDGDPSHLIFTLSPELQPYKHDLRRFIDAMLYKLKVHSSKGRWEKLDLEQTTRKLDGEVKELELAIIDGNHIEIILEAADVANYAMIVASISVERGE
jgi:phosphoribosyl-ATP pyrophosphohydrolase